MISAVGSGERGEGFQGTRKGRPNDSTVPINTRSLVATSLQTGYETRHLQAISETGSRNDSNNLYIELSAYLTRHAGTNILLVCAHPVHRNIVLGRSEVQFPVATELMKPLLQFVLNVRIPSHAIGLWPEITERLRATEIGRDEVIHLEAVRMSADA